VPETELKFVVDEAQRTRIARSAPLAGVRPKRGALATVYLDTPDGDLARDGLALRLRRARGRWTAGLKAAGDAAGGLHVRDEWEFPARKPEIDLAQFADTPLAKVRGAKHLHERLAPVFRVDVLRTTWDVALPGARLGVALDVGNVRAGPGIERICELEIECLEGGAPAAFDLARRLLDEVPLRPSALSKAQRGYRLLHARPAQPEKAKAAALVQGMTVAQAARRVVASGLEHLQANGEGVLESDDPEFVHQARVALRRTRSALRIFRNAIGKERARAWRRELGELGSALGAARDLDVFATRMLPPALQAHGDAGLARRLRSRASRKRSRARAAARAALRSPRFARVALELASWIHAPDPDTEHAASEPALRFAEQTVKREHPRLVERAQSIATLDAASRHRVRIEAKRLRYAVEAFASLFDARRTKRYLGLLAELQDVLGEANDAVTASGLLRELAAPPAFEAFARGWYAAHAAEPVPRLEKLVRRLQGQRPPGG
jgi:inorganic triphosphatase YgiF